MQPVSLQNINGFLQNKTIAVAGVSHNEKSFSASVIAHLQQKEYTIFRVNPNFTDTDIQRQEFQTIESLPNDVSSLLVLTAPSQTHEAVKQAIEKGITNIWIQQKSETTETIQYCLDKKVNLICNQCIFMFTQPEGFHKFHYNLKKLFGTLPR